MSWRYARGIISSDDTLFTRRDAPLLDRVVLDPVTEEDAGKHTYAHMVYVTNFPASSQAGLEDEQISNELTDHIIFRYLPLRCAGRLLPQGEEGILGNPRSARRVSQSRLRKLSGPVELNWKPDRAGPACQKEALDLRSRVLIGLDGFG